jgi:hypothetical protein
MAEQYIFNADAGKIFYEKLDDLHDKYVYHLLLSGVAPKDTDLESIKMTKSPRINKKYCERVVGGLVNLKPKIIVKLTEDNTTRLECSFTKINDNEYLNHIYMVQSVMDWPQLDKFSCQVWYLGETTMNQIKEHWE